MDGVTPLQILTLIIAILGLLVSIIALTWQVVAWRFTGSVIKVELLAGAAGHGGLVSGEIESFKPDRHAEEGFTEPLFVVRVRNVGRIAVDVTHWSIATPKGWAYTKPSYPLNSSNLPYRLEAGSAVDFYVPMREIFAISQNVPSSIIAPQNQIQGCVTLATGAERRSELHKLPKVN